MDGRLNRVLNPRTGEIELHEGPPPDITFGLRGKQLRGLVDFYRKEYGALGMPEPGFSGWSSDEFMKRVNDRLGASAGAAPADQPAPRLWLDFPSSQAQWNRPYLNMASAPNSPESAYHVGFDPEDIAASRQAGNRVIEVPSEFYQQLHTMRPNDALAQLEAMRFAQHEQPNLESGGARYQAREPIGAQP